jgi:glycosyltransferase involved in cell wall biosynthesis
MNSKLRINFIMSRTGEWPSGGHRVLYEHANHLSRRGHAVTMVHPGRLVIDPSSLDQVKNAVRYALRRVDGRYTPRSWFKVDPQVQLTCVPSLSEHFVPDGDVTIATAWQTAEWVSQYPKSKGRGFYFIQSLETWNGPEERVHATWKTPLRKIVLSRWLLQIAQSFGETAIYVPCGLDLTAFRIMAPSKERRPNKLLMLYHKGEWKGCSDGLHALSLVRSKDPTCCASLFGVPSRPATLPDWIEYHQSPSPKLLRELYNQAAIFVAPSRMEGWGLTGCEALLCGAALVATDIGGHREFAFHEQTALISPAHAPDALADNILRLIQDSDLRIRLARNGLEFVRQLTWELASSRLEAALCEQHSGAVNFNSENQLPN